MNQPPYYFSLRRYYVHLNLDTDSLFEAPITSCTRQADKLLQPV